MSNKQPSNSQQSTTLTTPTNPVGRSPALQPGGPVHQGNKQFFTAYSPKRRTQIRFPTEGRTKQSFKAECDINTIMARYMKTGLLDHVRQGVAQYLDVTGADFQDAQNLVAGAQSMFHALPSHIRTKFDNNPRDFLAFMENPANAEEARKMGLLPVEAPSSTPPTEGGAKTPPAPSTPAPAASKPGGDTPQTPSV